MLRSAMTQFRVVVDEDIEKSQWDDFVKKHHASTIFQSSSIYDIYKATPNSDAGVVALFDLSGEILALTTYFIIQESGIKSHFSKRAIIYGGPLAKDDNTHYLQTLLEFYTSIVENKGVIYTEVRNLFDVTLLNKGYLEAGFKYKAHLTIHNDLTKSEEELNKNLHRGRKSNIRRATKKGVITRNINIDNEFDDVYNMIESLYNRIELPTPPRELFSNSAKILKNNIKFWGAYLDGKLIGCRVYLLYKNMMYDWYAASDREYSSYLPSDLMPWNAMLWGKENGMEIYDFAGAGEPNKPYGVRDYKLKFGGELLELGRYLYIHNPFLYSLGKRGMKFYKHLR